MPYCPSNSKVLDLVSYYQYSVCQRFTMLYEKSTYKLKYDIFLDPVISSATLTIISNYQYNSQYEWKIYSQTYTVKGKIFS